MISSSLLVSFSMKQTYNYIYSYQTIFIVFVLNNLE
jgi:hypothetical protein